MRTAVAFTFAIAFATASWSRAEAQAVAITDAGRIAVAHDGIVELFAADAHTRLWKSGGVADPATIAIGRTRLAVVDPLGGRVLIAALDDGAPAAVIETHDTPIAALFAGDDLFVLERDGSRLERFAADGSRASVETGAYPEFLRQAGGMLYVYSRADGRMQEIAPEPFAVKRSVSAAPGATDFEIDGQFVYFAEPAESRITVLHLATLKPAGEMKVGTMPIDLAVLPGSVAAPRYFEVADPASNTVWFVEAAQSPGEAFGRGFLRGLFGLGVSRGRKSAFPTAVDRVFTRGHLSVAYDSSDGTLYGIARKSVQPIGTRIGPHAFALTGDGVVYWNGTLVAQKLHG